MSAFLVQTVIPFALGVVVAFGAVAVIGLAYRHRISEHVDHLASNEHARLVNDHALSGTDGDRWWDQPDAARNALHQYQRAADARGVGIGTTGPDPRVTGDPRRAGHGAAGRPATPPVGGSLVIGSTHWAADGSVIERKGDG